MEDLQSENANLKEVSLFKLVFFAFWGVRSVPNIVWIYYLFFVFFFKAVGRSFKSFTSWKESEKAREEKHQRRGILSVYEVFIIVVIQYLSPVSLHPRRSTYGTLIIKVDNLIIKVLSVKVYIYSYNRRKNVGMPSKKIRNYSTIVTIVFPKNKHY